MIFLSHLTICKWLIFIKSTRYMSVFICISSIKLFKHFLVVYELFILSSTYKCNFLGADNKQ